MTPEQIASTYKGGVKALRRLRAHGLHVFTDAELRTRDEQIIRASIRWHIANPYTPHVDHDDIIAAAEADQ